MSCQQCSHITISRDWEDTATGKSLQSMRVQSMGGGGGGDGDGNGRQWSQVNTWDLLASRLSMAGEAQARKKLFQNTQDT